MNYKKFGLVSIVIAVVIVAVCVVLCFIPSSTPLNISTPAYFNIYNHSTAATQITKENNEAKFNLINSCLQDMTQMSVFSRVAQGGKLDEKPSQDEDYEIGYFSTQLKQENLCLEVVFSDLQRQIVEVDGNTKVLEFYRMIFVVNGEGAQVLPIYLNHNAGNDNLYTGLPMLVRTNMVNLYNACIS